MSKQSSRKPSPNTVRPPSPRIVDPRKHSPRGILPISKNRKSPSLFEPNSSFSDRVGGIVGAAAQQNQLNVKPKPVRNLGLLDDVDLLSQSAFFDESDSEIQSIYERVVKDSTVQSSLQEIIAAQKLQAAYVHSQTQLLSLSSPLQSQLGTVAPSQGQGSYRGVSSSSSSFFAGGSHFVPHMQASPSQPSSSSNGPRVRDSVVQSSGGADRLFLGVAANQSAGGAGSLTQVEDETIRISLDEDQKSDNTTPAGYMLVETEAENTVYANHFSDFVLPQPESMSDDALLALVEFAHKEIWKRTHPSSGCNGLSLQGQSMRPAVPVHEKRKSSPSILPNSMPSKVGTTSVGGNRAATIHTHRRPRSKSGGSECAITGREEGVVTSASSAPMLMPHPSGYGADDYDNCCYSHRSVSSVGEDEFCTNDSGRVRPVEKMLGLTPGYLRKPSPASSPAHFNQGGSVPKANSRSSPWLVFDPPLNQGNQSPVQHSVQSSHPSLCRQSPSSPSPARPFTSSSPICIGSSGAGNGTSTGGGPIRLPAKKVTCVPVTLFSPEEHGEKRRKGDYFTLGNRYDDDDSHSFVSVTSSIGSGLDKDIVANRSLQQQLQQLIISPRTAFDDISVSSSEGSSCIRKAGYRKSSAHVTVTGKQKR